MKGKGYLLFRGTFQHALRISSRLVLKLTLSYPLMLQCFAHFLRATSTGTLIRINVILKITGRVESECSNEELKEFMPFSKSFVPDILLIFFFLVHWKFCFQPQWRA